jgi:hypothetical protein
LNRWTKREVTLYLSSEGKAVFAQTYEGTAINVLVEWADELGLWVAIEEMNEASTNVMLIRWHHFDTAVMDAAESKPKTPGRLGFVK